ncbi:MAG: hypothetical protein Kow0065_13440 [Methylomicrobium sp.]
MSRCPDPESAKRVELLNRECRCVSLDRAALHEELQGLNDPNLVSMLMEERPYLFAESAVFVEAACLRRQWDIIAAIERTIALPAYQHAVLSYAPQTAHYQPKTHGVFLGYDFHLGPEGPQLIEINTNAGGALINAILTRAQTACCEQAGERRPGQLPGMDRNKPVEQLFIDMFLEEWCIERGDVPLRTVAIVDEKPSEQYMYPEFLLFKRLFERNRIDSVICDPSELSYREGRLFCGSAIIDLVYNRLTDFSLESELVAALKNAYLDNAVVVTPFPRNHALYADKRNLALLTDEESLRNIGVGTEDRDLLLSGIARTTLVHDWEAERLWAERKQLFFKPAKGYGSKAAYRGDKLTRRVFTEILAGDYVAQQLVQPSERQLAVDEAVVGFKLDLRNYVYNARVQLVSARLYQGQTTNFRTPGGGFAQVVVV